MTTQETLSPVDRMYCDSIDAKPVDFDWSEGYDETWETILPDTDDMSLDQCRLWLDGAGYDHPDPNPWAMERDGLLTLLEEYDPEIDADMGTDALRELVIGMIDDEEIDGIDDWRARVREAMEQDERYIPVMSYYYPLPHYRGCAEDDQLLLDQEGGAACLARVDDEVVLALVGGGMDLSWDICQAYMLLGYLPPLHYCDLPEFAGMELTAKGRWVLEGCLRSCKVMELWTQVKREKLQRLLSSMPNPA
jgi:hypothetical protein